MNLNQSFLALKNHGNLLINNLLGSKNQPDSMRLIINDILQNFSSKKKYENNECYTEFNDGLSENIHNETGANDHINSIPSIIQNVSDIDEPKKTLLSKTPFNGPYLKIAYIIQKDNQISYIEMSDYFNIDSEYITVYDLHNKNITETVSGLYTYIPKINVPSEIPKSLVFQPNIGVTDKEKGLPISLYKESYIDGDGNTVDMYLKIREG